jgi:hypothetical protein
MNYVTRAVLILAGVVSLGIAAAFLFNFTPVTRLWPYPGYGLGKVFIASIFAAIGFPTIWIAWANEPASIPGGATNLLISGGGVGFYGLFQASSGSVPGALSLSVASLALAVLALGFLVFGLRQSFRDIRPTPPLVRWSFLLFVVLLVGIGGALVANVPNIFPWPLDRHSSVVYGFAFLGAAGYFGYGFVRPVWGNAKGQLLAFLAYDLALIWPYVGLWPNVSPALRLSLAIYIAVLVYSGSLAIYYLLIHGKLRLGSLGLPAPVAV